MLKLILSISCAFLIALSISGCIGLIVNSPEECKNETPFTGINDIFRVRPHERQIGPFGNVIKEVLPPQSSIKAEFLRDWGEP